MIALDTNVLVRVVTNDDPGQTKRALSRLRTDSAWVSRTVLLETAWVLRHAYGLDPGAVRSALSTLLGVGTIEMEDRAAVLRALSWNAAGMDFADALHLAVCGEASVFLSFDRALARAARRAGARPEVSSP